MKNGTLMELATYQIFLVSLKKVSPQSMNIQIEPWGMILNPSILSFYYVVLKVTFDYNTKMSDNETMAYRWYLLLLMTFYDLGMVLDTH